MSGHHRRGQRGPLRATLLTVPYTARMLPWATMCTGCVTGLAISLALSRLASVVTPETAVTLATRAAFVPPLATLAFLLSEPHRALTPALPVPTWWSNAARLGLACPLFAVTLVAQLHLAALLAAHLRSVGNAVASPPWPALVAESTTWSTVILAAGAVVARGRWRDLGGAIAAPVGLAGIATLWIASQHRVVAAVPGLPHGRLTAIWRYTSWRHLELPWYAVAFCALLLFCWESRDPWRRPLARR